MFAGRCLLLRDAACVVALRPLPQQLGEAGEREGRYRDASKKSKPIGFIQWSPARSVTYYKPGCTTQEQ